MTNWNWSYDDISNANYEHLMEIIMAKEVKKEKDVVPLHEFVKKI